MANNIQVSSVNFDGIKSGLKTHLSNTAVFKDYDFDGSGLSVMLDLLAYTTYYQAVYNNFVANEMFITSAEKRHSLVSHAKTLGYTPSSFTAPTATVNVTFGVTTDKPTTLRRGAVFTTSVDGKTYRFTNTTSATIDLYPATGDPNISNLDIREGIIRTISAVIPNNRDYQKVVIPDAKVDISTINVSVQASASDTSGITNTWSSATSLSGITASSRVYFVEQDFTGKYSVNFGEGVIGATLAPGNLVTISYLSTNGPLTNGVGQNESATGSKSFTYLSGNTVDVVNVASGGSVPESVEKIRRLAPRAYASQNRAVTANDIQALVENNFSGFSSVLAFGGQDANPPQYGRVIVCLKPNANETISSTLKSQVESYLKTKCPVSIQPSVVEPDLIYVRADTSVRFNENQTPLTETTMASLCKDLIRNYLVDNTRDFDTTVTGTLLQKSLTDTDSSIISASPVLRLEKRIVPPSGKFAMQFEFGNELFHPHDGHLSTVFSNEFNYTDSTGVTEVARVKDDGSGKLILFKIQNGVEVNLDEDFGTVDYQNGIVAFNASELSTYQSNTDIRVSAISADSILRSKNDLVLLHDTSDPSSNVVTAIPSTRTVTQTVSATTTADGTTTTTTTTTTSTPSGGGGGGGGGYGGY